jgi:quercetin dioxygenase-like cupin family protein
MKKFELKDMKGGWFVGDFLPTAFSSKDCEVAFKQYKAGGYDAKHLHKVATELTVFVKGSGLLNGIEYKEGDIILLEPGEATDFKALTDAEMVVVKIPSVKGDKYPA